MNCGYMDPSSDKHGVLARVESQSGSHIVTREADYHKTKDETRVDDIRTTAASAPSHLTFG